MSDTTYDGIYQGVVVDNDDPDFFFRVVCQIPQVLGDAHSNWAEPLLPTLYKPRIGESVWVQFVDGDPTKPLYQSRVSVNREMMEAGTMDITGDDIQDFSIEVQKLKDDKHFIYPAPVLTSNPGGGSISWGSFTIQYLGIAYPVSAGSTTKKYTWWKFNGGVGSSLQFTDTLPTTITDDDLLLFLNKSGIAVNAQTTNVQYGDLVVPGTILAGALGANSVAAQNIQANSISTDKLLVVPQGVTALVNSYFEEQALNSTTGAPLGTPFGWSLVWSAGATLARETASPISGTASAKVTVAGASGNKFRLAMNNTNDRAVAPGTKWYVSVRVRCDRDATNVPDLTFHTSTTATEPTAIFDSNATWQGINGVAPTANTTQQIQGVFTVPAGHTKMNVSVGWSMGSTLTTANWVIDEFIAYPATGDAQITDIGPGKISTGIVQAGTRIVAGAALSGARTEMNGSVGFQAFNSAGTETWRVNQADGAMYVGGTSGLRIQMTIAPNFYESGQNWSSISFYTGNSSWDPGLLWSNYISSSNSGYLSMVAPQPTGSSIPNTRVTLQSVVTGERSFNVFTKTLNFQANTMNLDAGTTASFDFNLAFGCNVYSFRNPGGNKINFDFAPTGVAGTQIFNADSSGNPFPLRVASSTLRVAPGSSNEVIFQTGTTSGKVILGSYNDNAYIHFGTSSNIIKFTTITGVDLINISAANVAIPSDAKNKSALKEVTGALDLVKAIPVYDYDLPVDKGGMHRKVSWISDKRRKHPRHRGVVAQDLRDLLPDAVIEDDIDGSGLTIDLYALVSTAIAAVKELNEKVDRLTSGNHKEN